MVGCTPTQLRLLTNKFVSVAIFVLYHTKESHKLAGKLPIFCEVEKISTLAVQSIASALIATPKNTTQQPTNTPTTTMNPKKEKMGF